MVETNSNLDIDMLVFLNYRHIARKLVGLGWGAWWFWEPVENAFLMPWSYNLYSFNHCT